MTGFFSMPLGYKFFYGSQVGGSGAFTACIASKPGTIDPAKNSTVDGGTYDEHLFEGLYRWSYEGTYPNGTVKLVPGLASAAPSETVNSDGTVTETYTLRDGLKWSDGSALTAADLVRSWKRAVSTSTASDYNYLFEAIVGGADAEGEADGKSLAVSATNDKTFVVKLVNKVSYWNELTAFPTFAPVPAAADGDGKWATSANYSTFVCNGPMKIKNFNESYIEFEPNPNYYDTSMVKATDIKFAFADDDSAILTSYQSDSYQFIDSFPNDQIDTLKTSLPKEYFNVGQLGTYYINWNINSTKFDAVLNTEPKRASFRNALSLLINRQYICDSVAKGGQIPANGFVSKGLTGANGAGDWTDSNGPAQDGSGWYKTSTADYAANAASAVELTHFLWLHLR
jgi:oligopeptide transport system substrate-binding protein